MELNINFAPLKCSDTKNGKPFCLGRHELIVDFLDLPYILLWKFGVNRSISDEIIYKFCSRIFGVFLLASYNLMPMEILEDHARAALSHLESCDLYPGSIR